MLNDYLMAPVDLARFGLAYGVLVLLPGYILATLARPQAPRSERIALAIPCAYGLVAIWGLATFLFHLPFGIAAYGLCCLLVLIAGIATRWRTTPPRRSEGGYWWAIAVLAVLVEFTVIALSQMHEVMPTGWDPPTHVAWAMHIVQSQSFPLMLASGGMAHAGFYPPVLHAIAALITDATAVPIYRSVYYCVVASAITLPLALFSFVRVITGNARLGGFAALASLPFQPLPSGILTEGLYSLVVSHLILPALVIALFDGLTRGSRRDIALAMLLGTGLFYTHPTEFVTVALLCLGIIPGSLRTWQRWRRATGYTIVVLGGWLISAIPVVIAVRRTITAAQGEAEQYFRPQLGVDVSRVLFHYLYSSYLLNLSIVLLVAVLLGIACCITARRLRGLLAVQCLLLLVYVDAHTTCLLRPFYLLSHPWAMSQRLCATQYWVTLPLAALGIGMVATWMQRLLRGKQRAFIALVASPIALVGFLPLESIAGQAHTIAGIKGVTAPTDLAALAWLKRHAPPGATVINDANGDGSNGLDAAIDAGLWMGALGGPQPLFGPSLSGPGRYPSLSSRYAILTHIADTTLPRSTAQYIARFHVRYVFYGADVLPQSKRHLQLTRLLHDPNMHVVYANTGNCRDDRRPCRPTAPYIFAFTQRHSPQQA